MRYLVVPILVVLLLFSISGCNTERTISGVPMSEYRRKLSLSPQEREVVQKEIDRRRDIQEARWDGPYQIEELPTRIIISPEKVDAIEKMAAALAPVDCYVCFCYTHVFGATYRGPDEDIEGFMWTNILIVSRDEPQSVWYDDF